MNIIIISMSSSRLSSEHAEQKSRKKDCVCSQGGLNLNLLGVLKERKNRL